MIYLNQSKYIGTIFKQFGMAKNKPIQIPFMTNYKLSKDLGSQNGTDLKVIWVIHPISKCYWKFHVCNGMQKI